MRARHRWSFARLAGRTFLAPALILIAVSGHAQDAGLEGGAAAPASGIAMDTATYPLSPGDVVRISVYGEPELTGSYKLSPTGTVSMLYADRVAAQGLTVDQLAEEIANQLRVYMKRPVVQVALDADASARQVYISGQVADPGAQTIPFGGTVAQAVLAAGTTAVSDLSAVRVTRSGAAPFTVDLSGLRGEGQLGEAPAIRNGDLIYVPKLKDADFAVYGMVAEPGAKPLEPDDADDLNVLRALGAAGGVIEGADLAEATIIRAGGQAETVDLRALLFEGDTTQNKTMSPGDALIVRAAGKITVVGEFNEPTAFPAPEPMEVLEVIAHAGGFTPLADLKAASILRAGGRLPIDLEGLWWKGDLAQNVLIQPGETLLVPERDPEEVLVVGAVEEPGSVDIHRMKDRGVMRFVQSAVPTEQADLRRVTLHRPDVATPIVVDVRSVTEQGNAQANVEVQDGDTIFVPELKKVYALGAFNTAGVHPLTDNMTVMELVGVAGSFRQDATPAKMRLVRPSPEGAEIVPINFKRIEKGLELGQIPLEEGDILFVPSKKPGGGWDRFRDIFWTAAGFLNIFF